MRRIIRKASPLTITEAMDLPIEVDHRDFYLLAQSRRAVLHMRHNHKEDGHTLVEYLALP